MGDITFSRVIDDAQAKVTARTIQKRLSDLGSTISYGHALEAAAAVIGYANWPTLQAALSSQIASENAPVIGSFPKSAIPSFRNELRSIAVVGDGGSRRQALTALVRQAISNYREQKEDVAYYVVDAPEDSDEALKIRANLSGKLFQIEPGKAGNRYNFLDLPAGERDLKPSWLRDQKMALLCLLFSGCPNRSTRLFLVQALEDLYERFSEQQHPQTKVRKYVPGTNLDIDARLAGQLPFSWWDVAAILRKSGLTALACQSERFAAPRFEDYVELVADMTPETIHRAFYHSRTDLEAACEFVRTRAVELLKRYPVLNCVTSFDASDAAGLVCSMPSGVSADTKAVMYALSVHQCKEHHYQRLLRSVEAEMKSGLRPLAAMDAAETLPKSLMVLGGFEAACCGSNDWKEGMVKLVQSTVHQLFKNVSGSHALFVEGGQSGTPLFNQYPRSRQNIVYVGTGGDQKKSVDLAVVKGLNLDHNSLELVNEKLPTEQAGPIGALLVRDEHGTQREDYVELPRP